jgi:hypothetical protein
MSVPFNLFRGIRQPGGRLFVIDLDGRQILSSSRTAFDWGPHADFTERCRLALTLLYHSSVAFDEIAAQAMAVAVVGGLPYDEFGITSDQVAAWYEHYIHTRGNHGQETRRRPPGGSHH